MLKMNKKTGFTLLEIIVVLIIVGVIATMALPNLFANVERQRAQEAINTLGTIRTAVEQCALLNTNQFTNCNTFAAIGMTDPSFNAATNAGSNFAYTFNPAPTATTYSLVATRVAGPAGAVPAPVPTVTMARLATGAVTCAGINAYQGVCR